MCSRKVSNAFRKEVTAGAGRRDFDAARRFIEDKKHRRFVSHWDDEEIRIDVAPNASGVSDVKTVFDSKTVIDFSGGESIFKPQGLRKHPELLATLKALVNEDCHAHDAGDIEREVGRTVRSFLRLIVWLFRHARYKLSKVEPELVQTLATELANGGWWSALDYDARFELLLQRANVDLKFRNSLEGSGHIGEFSCNMDAISRHLMLPIASASLPKAIVQRIAEATGSQRPVQKDKDLPLVSPHSLYQNLKFLNRCALIGGFDSFGERPFKSAHRRAIELYKGEHPDLRTENLGITDVVTIFTEAMRWIHVCADGVIMVCETARNELESCDPSVLSLEVIGDRVTRKTVALHEQIADSYGLPKALRALARNQESSLRHLILKLQFSCAIAVLFNHGRRREEVLGTGKTYGLYRGCLTPANDGRDGSYLDVYIEKTLQRYASMWANEIVERAVDVMERLGQTFRPLGTEPLAVAPTLDEARKEKLFVWRHFSYAAFNDRPNVFSFQEGAKLFFSDLNVSITKVSASHIYRRCFALIYMYRHDHPVLMALSRHLCHFTLETTRIYTTDGRDVADDRSIESLFAAIEKEDADFSDEFEDIRSTYFQEKVVNILSGVDVGGGFARIVVRICRKLESNASFREASLEEKARQTREVAEREGYAPAPMANTSCTAGSAARTKRQANCYNEEEDRVCPETASPATCIDCIHSIRTGNHLSTMEEEVEELDKAATDTKRPLHYRLAARDTADELRVIITRERASATEMKVLVEKLVSEWKPVVFREKSHA